MTKITAHAGCENTKPGSLENIRIAMDANVDFLEVDLLSFDDVVYLSHNVITDPTNLITLEQVIDMVRGTNILLNCDIKDYDVAQRVIDVLKKNNFDNKVVFGGSVNVDLVISNNINYILNIREQELLDPANFDKTLELYAFHSKNKNFMAFNIDYEWVNEECIEFFNRNEMQVCLWTIDDHSTIDKFMNKIEHMTTNEIQYALSKR